MATLELARDVYAVLVCYSDLKEAARHRHRRGQRMVEAARKYNRVVQAGTINNTRDFGIGKLLENLPTL